MTRPTNNTLGDVRSRLYGHLAAMGQLAHRDHLSADEEAQLEALCEGAEQLAAEAERLAAEQQAPSLRDMIRAGARVERGAFDDRGRGGDPLLVNTTGGGRRRADADEGIALLRDETVQAWGRRTGRLSIPADHGMSFDKLVRGLAVGEWDNADAELRAVSETPVTAGGHLVPTPLAAGVIDRARNTARVMQLGAQFVPMTSATQKMPRLEQGVTPDWRNENDPINDKALVFGAVTLTARSLACMIKISFELFDDASIAGSTIEQEFAAAFALEVDRVSMTGTGTAPQPRGLRNTSGVTITAFGGANGATPLNYDLCEQDGIPIIGAMADELCETCEKEVAFCDICRKFLPLADGTMTCVRSMLLGWRHD